MFAIAAREAGLAEYPNDIGYLVTGISSDCDQAEVWLLEFSGSDLEPAPTRVLDTSEYGWRAYAQPSAINRLFNGYDDRLELMLRAAVPDAEQLFVDTLLAAQQCEPVLPGMPLPDSIALARFMVETTEGFSRFLPGPDTVGGAVEVASISPHEGFRWISRKHYFSPALNPGELR